MSITINGKVYRTLEEQVRNNQEDSNAAIGYARDAQDSVQQTARIITALRDDLTALETDVEDLEATAARFARISEAVKGADGTVVPSAIWDGEVNINTQVYDIYCTIPISYANQADYVSEVNLATALFGGPVPVKLPDAFESSSAKEIYYTVHKSDRRLLSIVGFDLNSSPLLTTANGWKLYFDNGLSPWQTYNFNLCIHVHGRIMV